MDSEFSERLMTSDDENSKEFLVRNYESTSRIGFRFPILFIFFAFSTLIFLIFLANFYSKSQNEDSQVLRATENYSDFIVEINSSLAENSINKFPFFYFSEEESEYLNCDEFIKGNSVFIDRYVNSGRLKLIDRLFDLPMDCQSIKFRIFGNSNFSELERPIAFIRNIFQIYELQEALLSSIYHPNNIFCYVLDEKSTKKMKENMRKVANCLPNVFVLQKEYNFDSSGHRQDRAHFDCLQKVLDLNWFHAIILQSSDLIIKTPYQISEISKILNYTSTMGLEYGFPYRYETNKDWSPAGLKLFKNESGVSSEILHKPLRIRKGLNEVMISKIFVKSIFEKLNLTTILSQFDDNKLYGVDEMLINTLYENNLGLEGQMESNCKFSKGDSFTRYTPWHFSGSDGYNKDCKSKFQRHGICILGVEFLPSLATSNFLIANKVMAKFDFGTVLCTKQMIHQNRTAKIPGPEYFEMFPQFKEMEQKSKGIYHKKTFLC